MIKKYAAKYESLTKNPISIVHWSSEANTSFTMNGTTHKKDGRPYHRHFYDTKEEAKESIINSSEEHIKVLNRAIEQEKSFIRKVKAL